MSPTPFHRFFRRRPLLAMFICLAIVVGIPTGVALWVGHDKDVKIAHQQQVFVNYQVSQAVHGCQASNRGRKALQTVLDRAAHPPQTGAAIIDFSSVEGFAALDASTKFFLENLEAALNIPASSANLQDIADDYRHSNPSNVDCAAVGGSLRIRLEAS